MVNRYVYLLGGNPTLADAVESFVHLSGGKDAKLVLLTVKKGAWEKHVPRYTEQWKQLGVSNIEVIAVDDNAELSNDVLHSIREATGIFIGGGHTETYHAMYAFDPVKTLLKEKYQNGVPIAGCSAGALILPGNVAISPNDNDDKQLKIVEGVGLLSSILISVHYSQWKEREHVLEAMKRVNCYNALGLDEEAAILLCNEEPYRTFGPEKVYHLTHMGQEGIVEQVLSLSSM
jgi:cyanophycinase